MSSSTVSHEPDVRVVGLPGDPFPIALVPARPNLDFTAWSEANRAEIDARLAERGAIVFRGFDLPTPAHFERAAKAAFGELFSDYGDLPRAGAGGQIYESTPYPIDQMILFHNESSHLASWPLRIAFHCVQPAAVGGDTPLLDSRAALTALDPGVVAEFRAKGLRYVRNFSAGIDPSWEQFFHTSDRAEVEAMCRAAGSEFEWRGDALRVSRRARAVTRHPITGDETFFNQIQHHHIACVDEETRDGLRALFDDEDLPRHVYYGDGSLIPDDVVDHIGAVYEKICVRIPWQAGDVIMLDNMLAAHARDPYEGARQIVVAMGRITSDEGAANS